MEGTSRFILQLFLLCAFVCLACSQSCPSQHQTSAKFTVTSRRNQTGQWISEVQIKHGADNTLTTGPWTAEVEHNTASCNGVETVQVVATLTGPKIRAGPGYELHSGVGYYKVHSELKTWFEANTICKQEGGHLAIINSEEESRVLKTISAAASANSQNHEIFIGFHDLYNEGQYLTVFDEPLSSTGFTRWAYSDQPNNWGDSASHPGQDCGAMHTSGGLSDWECHVPLPFICEQEL